MKRCKVTKMKFMVCSKDENCTVNSEIFVRVLFSRNFAYAKFREHKTLPK